MYIYYDNVSNHSAQILDIIAILKPRHSTSIALRYDEVGIAIVHTVPDYNYLSGISVKEHFLFPT